jgi:predicted  nucleic acid-binding Zn-ribbon protein
MPRKKSTKRQPKNDSLAMFRHMEKDFLITPTKIATKLNKEMVSLQQTEARLKKQLHKAKTQVKQSEARLKTAAKSKHTMVGKKQFNKIKKVHSVALKAIANLQKDSQNTTSLHEKLTKQQAKLLALHRHLAQFEKSWQQQAKKQSRKKTKVKSKVKASPEKIKVEPALEKLMEQIQLDPKTEVVS